MITGTLDRNRRERVTTDGGKVAVHRNYIITSPMGELPSPQVYLVEQEPGNALRTHFHMNSQFQVFVTGAGTIGSHEARPYVVQYADRQTGYGPITPGEGRLEYLTLRPTTIKDRAKYLPESRDLVDRNVPKRSAICKPIDLCPAQAPKQTTALIAPTADGLGAWYVHVPPAERCEAPELENGSGRFYIVVGGHLATPEGTLPPMSVAWTGPGEQPPALDAGEDALDVLVLQFPKNAWS